MGAFLLSFSVIFVAEIGDKSQLMAVTFATRYRFWTVFGGITAATALVHLASVGLVTVVGVNPPTTLIRIVAGIAFLVFGAWTLRGDKLSEDEQAKAGRSTRSAFFAVAIAFFLAELGDDARHNTLATTEGCSAPGLAPRSGWSPPTRWPSPSGPCWAASCRRRPFALARPSCSGMVAWATCRYAVRPRRENIEVRGSHLGLMHNPAVLWLLADRLGQHEAKWKPFRPTLPLVPFFPRRWFRSSPAARYSYRGAPR